MATRSITVAAERKKVVISDIRGEKVRVLEHGVEKSSHVDLNHRLADWLGLVLRQCSTERRVGFFRHKLADKEELSVLVKKGRGAIYASVQLKGETIPNSPKYVYLPAGSKGSAWASMSKAISTLRRSNRSRSNSPLMFHQPNIRKIRTLQNRSSPSYKFCSASQDNRRKVLHDGEVVHSSRKVIVVVKVINFDWCRAAESLKELVKLQETPAVQVLEGKKAIFICSSPEEVRRLLMVSTIKLLHTRVSFLQYQDNNIKQDDFAWWNTADRWVAIHGLPPHLQIERILTPLVASFGQYLSAQYPVNDSSRSTILVFVKNCEILKVPHFLPLSDNGVLLPLRVEVVFKETVTTDGVEVDTKATEENLKLFINGESEANSVSGVMLSQDGHGELHQKKFKFELPMQY